MPLAIERFDAVLAEIQPLWRRHWEEVALNREAVPLDPDLEGYRMLEAAGALRIYTLRVGGALVGYQFFIVRKHLHYKSTIFAQNDLVWVDPAHRAKGGLLIRYALRHLKAEGVVIAIINVKPHVDFSRLLVRMGGVPADQIHLFNLRD